MNSLTRLSVGLETQTHVLELLGRRAKDWQKLVAHRRNLACFWMAWSRSRIRLVHKKAGCVNLPSRRFTATGDHFRTASPGL